MFRLQETRQLTSLQLQTTLACIVPCTCFRHTGIRCPRVCRSYRRTFTAKASAMHQPSPVTSTRTTLPCHMAFRSSRMWTLERTQTGGLASSYPRSTAATASPCPCRTTISTSLSTYELARGQQRRLGASGVQGPHKDFAINCSYVIRPNISRLRCNVLDVSHSYPFC